MRRAEIRDGYEFQLLNGTLYVTSEENPDVQVALSPEAVKSLIEYLYSVPEGNDPEEARELVRYILN